MGWNGTRMKVGWVRLRGNASGRTYDWRFVTFFCDGCQKRHGRRVTRTLTLDKLLLCDRQYYRHMDGKPFFKTAQNQDAA